MKIEVYCLANNEERMMPYFMRHYTQFAKVIILENNSTDRTVEIAKSMGATIWAYDVPDVIDDQWYIDVKNSCWKASRADWVIICDADEFVYHPNIVNILKDTDATIFTPQLFNMFSNKFPTTEGQIYEEVNRGKSGGGKMNLFRPSEIKQINYQPGCHVACPEGNVRHNPNSEIITLHMRNLSKEYLIERNGRSARRLSPLNQQMRWGWHFGIPAEELSKFMDDEMVNLTKVL